MLVVLHHRRLPFTRATILGTQEILETLETPETLGILGIHEK
jgi:hypothetical protein